MDPCSVFFIILAVQPFRCFISVWDKLYLHRGFLMNMYLEMRNRAIFFHHNVILCKNSTQLCYQKLENLFEDLLLLPLPFLTSSNPRNLQGYNLGTFHKQNSLVREKYIIASNPLHLLTPNPNRKSFYFLVLKSKSLEYLNIVCIYKKINSILISYSIIIFISQWKTRTNEI